MIGQIISDLEKVTTVPPGSAYVAAMGDGSGTKAVTHETLVRETGRSLKVGNIEDLQTENKTSIVAAINEAAQSGGGGVAVDILDTKEEIEANTEPGKAAGAKAVKEMFSALNDNFTFPDGTKFYPDVKDGVRGYNTDAARGADTFCPFSNHVEDSLTFVSTGIKIYSGRVKDIEGGYAVKDGMCYVDLTCTTAKTLSSNGAMYGFPQQINTTALIAEWGDYYNAPCFVYTDSSLGAGSIDMGKGLSIPDNTKIRLYGKYKIANS